eukprot:gnl/TRDRNA2_/TRDRNA2_41648_c0_seq1.p1 gnl/TRDRNA2_/TRDRNA2_41648_c0~~gnl/TRDRNA2_/TRDRNA2_41648_c0_seq1.p1  ORF type:complete len:347 (+),score=20.24 gnl/TRDRNA2_/TRDRNA2_41648_c0_seq1:75-1115(+)
MAVKDKPSVRRAWIRSPECHHLCMIGAKLSSRLAFVPAVVAEFLKPPKALSVVGCNRRLYIVEEESGRVLRETPLGATSSSCLSRLWQPQRLAYEPNGDRIAVLDVDNHLRVIETASGKTLYDLGNQVSDRVIYAMAFSPCGDRIALLGEGCSSRGLDDLRVVNAQSGNLICTGSTTSDQMGGGSLLAFAPNGNSIVTANSSGLFAVNMSDKCKGPEVLLHDFGPLPEMSCGLSGVAYAPDGDSIAVLTMKGLLMFIEARAGGQVLYTSRCGGVPNCLAYCPGGGRIAVGGCDGRIRIFSTDDGELLSRVEVDLPTRARSSSEPLAGNPLLSSHSFLALAYTPCKL